ncbi:hypothetical protein DL89DRAFT_131984 [Linderina pennispora]|uniref:Uncharacterized protein n=1 Tax=Linderina pennispora TaxID=61395 RepID=A0A1Y1VV33_9FUNG|nr:uncharacterized protein DL89DRAFT_131984 [Linderina pennispora]ORX65148.1 hypothetical protein DL89DRAFT_131984 [Linderina pennispora]
MIPERSQSTVRPFSSRPATTDAEPCCRPCTVCLATLRTRNHPASSSRIWALRVKLQVNFEASCIALSQLPPGSAARSVSWAPFSLHERALPAVHCRWLTPLMRQLSTAAPSGRCT